MEGVISVIPNRKFQLHTTRSWDFVGFSKSQLSEPQEEEVIIGLLDTGHLLSKYFSQRIINPFC